MGSKGIKKAGDLVKCTRSYHYGIFLRYDEDSEHHCHVWIPDINKTLLFLTRDIDIVRHR